MQGAQYILNKFRNDSEYEDTRKYSMIHRDTKEGKTRWRRKRVDRRYEVRDKTEDMRKKRKRRQRNK